MGEPWGWAGTVGEFLSLSRETWLTSLARHHEGLMQVPPSRSQTAAWVSEHQALSSALRDVSLAVPAATEWGIAFEFELPLEGGRRPDVVVLAGAAVVVLEFKDTARAEQAHIDQVAAYASDLAEYHSATHGRSVFAFVVHPSGDHSVWDDERSVAVTNGTDLAHYLINSYEPGVIDLRSWLDAEYAPLPTLVAAARRIFRNEPLPHVRRALAAGVPETVELLTALTDQAEAEGRRMLAFVTGVPGSGKTLVGLRLVYERSGEQSTATFLSGNGPLVAVLRDVLKSKVFVNDLHAFIRTFGLNEARIPQQHVLVFDEAQRAWDRPYMQEKRGVDASEPDILVAVGERLPGWAALVGLVGDGQEIHSGEEAGLRQWRDAVAGPPERAEWAIHCPPRLASEFSGLAVQTHDRLDLTISLRSKRADMLHAWVAHVLEGSLALASRIAARIQADAFPMYLTRDIDDARAYVVNRFDGDPVARFGLLASSHDKVLRKLSPPIDNGFQATTKVMNYARWYNGDLADPKSSLHLDQPVTEFGCQGLELDLPIVCWGDDYVWDGRDWRKRPVKRRYRQEDPEGLLTNAYRVLLTRGREGLVVFIPPVEHLDLTEHALLAAGVRPLPVDIGGADSGPAGTLEPVPKTG